MKNKLVFYLSFIAVMVILCLSMFPVMATENKVTVLLAQDIHSNLLLFNNSEH